MAKKKKVEPVIEVQESEVDLLGTPEVEVKVTEEGKAELHPKKEKKLVGYHPITGAEVWI